MKTIKRSKGYIRLYNRLNDFMCDYEFAQILFNNRDLLKGDESVFVGITKEATPELFKHDNTGQARIIITKHLQTTIAVTFIKEVYEEVTEYLRYILAMGARSGKVAPERISADVKVSLPANEILATSTHAEAITLVTQRIYQTLESERSTLVLIDKICAKLDLKVNRQSVNDALKYLEMRHIFIHEDGKPNKEFKKKYPDVEINKKGRIKLIDTNLHTVKDIILKLISEIDEQIIKKNLIITSEIQP